MTMQTFRLPDVGEGLTEAEILDWRVAVGDTVTVNQIIVEIETAKAAVELPSPFAGTVTALLVESGATVEVGAPIISIDDGTASAPAADAAEPAGTKIGEVTADGKIATLVGYVSASGPAVRRPRKPVAAQEIPADGQDEPSRVVPLAAPPVRKLAKDLGVDLGGLTGSGEDGVITRDDVQRARTSPAVEGRGFPAPADEYRAPVVADRERRVPIKGVRKATAAAMVASAYTAPHVSVFLTVDVTEMMHLRHRLRSRSEFSEVKITPLTFAARAVCKAMERTADVNAWWDDAAQEIVFKNYVNLGIAAATPRGLVVPNVKNAHLMGLHQMAAALTELTEVARAGRTSPADMTGGTFTITNIGVLGVDTGTPIINPGESAILALGSIKDAPWVVDGELAVRKVCQLALSFDHRVIDGEQGSRFLADVGSLMAEPGLALAW